MKLDGVVNPLALGYTLHPLLKDSSKGIEITTGRHRHNAIRTDRFLEGLRSIDDQDVAMVHDGQSVTEGVCLLHVVSGQKNGLSICVQPAEDFPEGNAALGIQSGC